VAPHPASRWVPSSQIGSLQPKLIEDSRDPSSAPPPPHSNRLGGSAILAKQTKCESNRRENSLGISTRQ